MAGLIKIARYLKDIERFFISTVAGLFVQNFIKKAWSRLFCKEIVAYGVKPIWLNSGSLVRLSQVVSIQRQLENEKKYSNDQGGEPKNVS